MLIYVIIIFSLSVFATVEVNISDYYKKQVSGKILIPIAWLLIVCQMALRWDMATDWGSYHGFFLGHSSWTQFKSDPIMFERGYWLLNIFSKSISDSYTFFLFITEGTFYFLLFRFFKFSTPYALLAILLYYGLFVGLTGSHRQLLALAICLSGLKCLIEGSKMKFIGLILLASLFHATSLLFLVFLFLNINIPISVAFIIIATSYVIGQTKLPILLFSTFAGISEYNAHKVEAYIKSAESAFAGLQVSKLGMAKKILLPTIFFLTKDKILKKHKHYNLILNGYLLGSTFYFLFFKTLLVMISRGSLYFNAMEPILLSLQLTIIKDKKLKNLVLLLLCIFTVVFFTQSIKAYPELFIPYKSIFNKD